MHLDPVVGREDRSASRAPTLGGAALLLGVACLVGCDAIGSLFGAGAPSSAGSSEPAPAAPSGVVSPAPGAVAALDPARAARATPTTPEERRQIATAIREGRAAAHEGRLAEAGAAFERALRLEPRNPRVSCEAGLIAHQLHEEERAARRMDAALVIFGDDRTLAPAMRVPAAMCLYNRGLVHEAVGDPAGAREAFDRSLALRPNATVQARRDALTESASASTEVSVAGTRVSVLAHAARVPVSTVDALRAVLAAGLGGSNDFEDGSPSAGSVEPRGSVHPLTWPGFVDVSFFVVDDQSVPIGSRRLVIAARRAGGGYDVATLEVGAYDATDHGTWAGTDATIEEPVIGAAALTMTVDLCWSDGYQQEAEVPADATDDTQCFEEFESGQQCETAAVVCGVVGATLTCGTFTSGRDPADEAHHEVFCEREDGTRFELAVPPAAQPTALPAFELSCSADDLARVRCVRVGGTDAEALVGEHTLAALAAADDARWLSGDLREDASDGAEEGGDEEEGEEGEEGAW